MSSLQSMTGFAVGMAPMETGEITCEIRSLNSRYLEIYVKLPRQIYDLEDAIKEIIRKKLDRGKISCTINLNTDGSPVQNLRVNADSVRFYKNLLEQIRDSAGLKEPLRLEHLLDFKEILAFENGENLGEGSQAQLLKLVENVCEKLQQTRAAEGKHLQSDLEERLTAIEKLVKQIEVLGKGNAKIEFNKLCGRVFHLVDEGKIDRNRLEMELALIADRVDITEELVRMGSHISLFRKNLKKGSPIGKKLNFILQEMHREANTISSKNSLIEISTLIVSVKEEIEKIREQVQNIE